MCRHMGGGQRTTSGVGLFLPPCLRGGLFVVCYCVSQLLGVLLSAPSILTEIIDVHCCVWFYVGSEDPNSVHQASTALLHPEPSPQPKNN